MEKLGIRSLNWRVFWEMVTNALKLYAKLLLTDDMMSPLPSDMHSLNRVTSLPILALPNRFTVLLLSASWVSAYAHIWAILGSITAITNNNTKLTIPNNNSDAHVQYIMCRAFTMEQHVSTRAPIAPIMLRVRIRA